MAYYDKPDHSIGRLTARLANDASMVKDVSGQRLGLHVQNNVAVIFALVIAFVSSWQLTLVVIAIFPFMLISGKLEMAMFTGMKVKGNKAFRNASHLANDAANNIRTVSAYNLQNYFVTEFSRALHTPKKELWKSGGSAGLGFGISQFFMLSAYALAFYVGGKFLEDGIVDFEELNRVFFASECYLGHLFTPFSFMACSCHGCHWQWTQRTDECRQREGYGRQDVNI